METNQKKEESEVRVDKEEEKLESVYQVEEEIGVADALLEGGGGGGQESLAD